MVQYRERGVRSCTVRILPEKHMPTSHGKSPRTCSLCYQKAKNRRPITSACHALNELTSLEHVHFLIAGPKPLVEKWDEEPRTSIVLEGVMAELIESILKGVRILLHNIKARKELKSSACLSIQYTSSHSVIYRSGGHDGTLALLQLLPLNNTRGMKKGSSLSRKSLPDSSYIVLTSNSIPMDRSSTTDASPTT